MRHLLLAALFLSPALAAAEEPSVALGRHIAITGGCHDCHTAGFAEAGGKIDPARALIGSPVGFQGPWGTTYPSNLRLVVGSMDEAQWASYAKTMQARPPMPWFNVNEMTETETRSLYRYIRSLGEPGQPAPDATGPGEEPETPFVVLVPPQMPAD